ncbi:NusB antitermination factor [Neorhodopirellula lusitana]|uniref:Transcription antitermination protein NusB n=1 Tax=Neorhodopirellula lusitana TaxID=445327 RepID=A0ABY1QJK8_9BACT|nr:transcription antitermination factor NusB [Neorhodopirellula lusitana]SMP73209.1 NusB antitermination factor [Neorhodopirellula lusitana]
MSTRRRAREIVLQLLYEADLNDWRDADARSRFIRSRLQGRKLLSTFAADLLEGTLKQRDAIDVELKKLSTNWALTRMPVTDRNVLRLGAYEILFAETPGQVAISEALTLARRYGGENSPRFINGVLDRLFKKATGRLNPGGDTAGDLKAETSDKANGQPTS